MVKDSCGIECNKLCLYYSFLVKEKGLCQDGTKCESACVSKDKKIACPSNMFWTSNRECVSIDECMCVTENGQPIKVG